MLPCSTLRRTCFAIMIRAMRGSSRSERTCLSDSTLAAFAEGRLAEAAHAGIEEHVADCSDCRAVLVRAAGAERPEGLASSDPSGTEADPEALAPGARVGRYVVQRLIGRGAMGAVYAASDPDLDRKVAVKLLRADALSDAARRRTRARLLREAQAMARLSHPEVITVYDVGAFGNELFVAMEYVEGETLRHWRDARPRAPAEILAVYERAGRGLAAAHEAGLVHRDFKPDNVLIGRDGRVRVTDFGLARSVDDQEAASEVEDVTSSEAIVLTTTLTRTGTLVGTPAYMAPEQLRGGAADARSDVFSFCVALYESLYGERPFAGSTLPGLRAAIEQGTVRAAPVLTSVPAGIRGVLLRGLRAAPDERWTSMRALLDAFGEASAAPRRRRLTVGAAAGAIGLLLVAVVVARSVPAVGSREAAVERSAPAAVAYPLAHAEPTDRRAEMQPLPEEPMSTLASPFEAPPVPLASARRRTSVPVSGSLGAPRRPRAAGSADPNPAPQVGSNGAMILE
jgi:tRNA A-37 threonylcarbamoyl transferase component Bud32